MESFVSGTSARPLLYLTVDAVLKSAAELMPDNLALIVPYQGVRWTFADLDREVDRVTRGLLACGLEPGDRIGIWAPNRSEWLLTMFAAARAGLILVNINPAYRITELEFALQLVGCRALVFAPQFKSSDYAAMLDSLIPELRTAAPGQLLCSAFPELRVLVQLGALAAPRGCLSFDDVISAGHGCVSTVGRVHPHVQVKIVDSQGRVTPRGVAGELLTRGYNVMRGYWDDLERTREAIDEGGWMHTGDLALIDEEGYCNIVGRLKDMIIRGGENISPRELEEFLYRHPAVIDVAVVGVPDAKYGEAVCACIRLRDGTAATEEEIREFCRGRIAHYKVPTYVRFVDSFPLTISGKVQKYLIREHLRIALNLSEQAHA